MNRGNAGVFAGNEEDCDEDEHEGEEDEDDEDEDEESNVDDLLDLWVDWMGSVSS